MPEMKIPSEFDQQLRQALDVPEPDRASFEAIRERFIAQGTAQLHSSNGRVRGLAQPAGAFPSRGWFSSLSLAWKLSLALLVVLVVSALFSPRVVNALRGLFGYIPNVGLVDQSAEVLILAEPVQSTLDGIPLTVESAFATSEKTVVIYQYIAQPWDGSQYPQTDLEPQPTDRPALLLADGSRLAVVSGRRQPAENQIIRYALEFGPLPPNTTTVTLLLDRLAGMPPDLGPRDWSILLSFKPGDPAEILFPVTVYEPTAVIAPGTATPMANQVVRPTSEPTLATVVPAASPIPGYGASIVLEKAVELQDGYLLMGSLRWTDPSVGQDDLELGMPVISDAHDQNIEYEVAPVETYPQPGELRENWAIQIPAKTFAAPLRVEFYITLHEKASIPFQFDPGLTPHNEQTYALNIDLPVNTHRVKIVSARYENPAPNNHLFLFTMTADTNVIGARIIDPAHPPMGGGGGANGIPLTDVAFTSGLFVEGELPQGALSLEVAGLDVLVPGNWVLTWSPEK